MLGQGLGALKSGGGGLEPPNELWFKYLTNGRYFASFIGDLSRIGLVSHRYSASRGKALFACYSFHSSKASHTLLPSNPSTLFFKL